MGYYDERYVDLLIIDIYEVTCVIHIIELHIRFDIGFRNYNVVDKLMNIDGEEEDELSNE